MPIVNLCICKYGWRAIRFEEIVQDTEVAILQERTFGDFCRRNLKSMY